MSNKCVYYKEKEQKSIDGGITWVDTGNFRKGGLISTQASQCGSFVTEYRWTKADYVCDNANKYKGYKQQVSYDNGGSWVDTGVVDIGALIESNSKDCGYDEQWFVLTGDKDFICDGAAKYKKKEMKYTRDSGTTWNSFDPPKYEKGDLIEETSSDCASMKVTYLDGTTKYFNGLTFIGENTVSDKVNVKEVEIYDGVRGIGDSAFKNCKSLTGITIPNSVTEIDRYAFMYCSSLTGITLSDNLILIGSNAFASCYGLTGVTIPNSVTRIGNTAFAYCTSLTGITIGNSVTSIGIGAFTNCTGLTSVTISDSVTSIDNYAFNDCSSLTTMTVNATTPPTLGNGAIPTTISRIYVPADSVDKYKTADGWKDYADKIWAIGYDEQWFTLTGDKDFICSEGSKYKKKEMKYTRDSGTTWNSFDPPKYEKGDLIESNSSDCATPSMKVTYTDNSEKTFYNLTSIEEYTDSNKANAKNVVIYDSVTTIGWSAFDGCPKLESATIPNSVTNIKSYAFADCASLTSITIPNSVTSIGQYAFANCSSLTGITIPNGVAIINNGTFFQCSKLADIVIPNNVLRIDTWAFYHCSLLTGITIPNSVTSIGQYAFANCSSLTDITIPANVTIIDYKAFYACLNLATMMVEATTPPTLGSDAFANSEIQTIYVSASSVNAYKSADGWSNYADKIKAIPQ